MSAHKPDSLAIVDMAGEGFVTNFTDADLKYIALERAKMRGRLFSMERSTPLTIRRLAAIEEALCHRIAGEIEDEGTEHDDPWTVAHCGSGEGNEAVIVEVLNAAPQLLDTIEAQVTRIEALEAELGNEKAHYETAQANWDLCLDRIEALEAALRIGVGCAYPVAQEINKRGYNWSEAYLDSWLPEARKAL